jgi:hypothetical protein
MNPLESRKRLLLAESELNRNLLIQEWQATVGEARALTSLARRIGSLVSAVVSLLTGLTCGRPKAPPVVPEKTPWWRLLLKVAGFFGS